LNYELWNEALGSWQYVDTYHNGTIAISTLTDLTGPTATPTVPILISVRGGQDLEFANPVNTWFGEPNQYGTGSLPGTILSYFSPQSTDLFDDTDEALCEKHVMGVSQSIVPHLNECYFGEKIVSVRQLMRRMTRYDTRLQALPASTGSCQVYSRTMNMFPAYWGFDSNGLDTANNLSASGTGSFNNVGSSFITFVTPWFVGWRGSMNWHFNPINNSSGPQDCLQISRNPIATSLGETFHTSSATTDKSNFAYQHNFYCPTLDTAGTAMTSGRTQVGVSAQVPFYSMYQFMPTGPQFVNGTAVVGDLGTGNNNFTFSNFGYGGIYLTGVQSYVGIGTDFSVFYFNNVPALFMYASYPTPT